MRSRGHIPARGGAAPSRGVDEIKAAIGFLTRVPTASSSGARTGAAAFAIVGGLIGLVGAVPLLLIGTRASLAAGGLAIGAIALVSGGLHLDGLADTADALAAPTAEAATRARKDPRVGAAGATAIAIAVVVDAALLGALVGGVGRVAAAVGCVAAAAGSRAVPPLVAVVLLRRTRGESRAERTGGAGAWFAQRASPRTAIAAGASAAAIGIVGALVAGGPAVLFGVLLGMVVGTGVAGWLAVVRGRVDGDGYGAIVEVTFAAILLTTVLAT